MTPVLPLDLTSRLAYTASLVPGTPVLGPSEQLSVCEMKGDSVQARSQYVGVEDIK